MEGHHKQVEQLGEDIEKRVATWRTSARSADEEEHILPVVATCVPQSEWDDMGNAAGVEVDPALRPVGVGMPMYEGDPEVADVDPARLPAEARSRQGGRPAGVRGAFVARARNFHSVLAGDQLARVGESPHPERVPA